MSAGRVGVSVRPVAGDRVVALRRRASLLAWATIAYNAVEGVIAVAAGAAAGSGALISFGLDSAIEVASAMAIAWQFASDRPETRERHTLRAIALAFFALAGYVAIDAAAGLLSGDDAGISPVGIVLTALSLVAMPILVVAKRRVGHALGSPTVLADARQTLLCASLSVAVFAGLLANATLGWAWTDHAAALVVAAFAVREGIAAWRGDACCAPPITGAPTSCGCAHETEDATAPGKPATDTPGEPATGTPGGAAPCGCTHAAEGAGDPGRTASCGGEHSAGSPGGPGGPAMGEPDGPAGCGEAVGDGVCGCGKGET